MHKLFLAFFFFVLPMSAYAEMAPLPFNPKILKGLRTRRSLAQVFCESNKDYFVQKACKELGPEQLRQLAPQIQIQSPSAIFVKNGGALIDVRRTNEPMVMMINRKKLNLTQYKTFKDLSEAISKTLPRTTGRYFWLQLNEANAQDTQVPLDRELLGKMIGLIGQTIVSDDVCSDAKKAYEACDVFSRKSPSLAVFMGVVLDVQGRMQKDPNDGIRPKERDLYNKSALAFETEMRELSSDLEKTESRREAIASCPSQRSESQNAWDDFMACYRKFQDNLASMQSYTPTKLKELRGTDEYLIFFPDHAPATQTPLGPEPMPSPQR